MQTHFEEARFGNVACARRMQRDFPLKHRAGQQRNPGRNRRSRNSLWRTVHRNQRQHITDRHPAARIIRLDKRTRSPEFNFQPACECRPFPKEARRALTQLLKHFPYSEFAAKAKARWP